MFRRKDSKRDSASEPSRRKDGSTRSSRPAESAVSGSSSRRDRDEDRERSKRHSRSSRDDRSSRPQYSSYETTGSRRSLPASSSRRDSSPTRSKPESRSYRSMAEQSTRTFDGESRRRRSERSDGSELATVSRSQCDRASEKRRALDRDDEDDEEAQLGGQEAAYTQHTTDQSFPPNSSQWSQSHSSESATASNQTSYSHSSTSLLNPNPHGEAADYYNDQGQSVAFQPGVRPGTPIIIGAEPHLMAASAEAAPPEETGHGAAAEFFAASANVEPLPTSTHSVPSMQFVSPRVSPSASPAPSEPSRPSKPSKKPSSTSMLGVAAATAIGASALENGHSLHTGINSASYVRPNENPSADHATSHSDYLVNGRPPSLPHQHSSLQHEQYAMEQGDKGAFRSFLDWWNDYEDVRKMEEYTEYIGVCKYCFDRNSSPWQAPRPHHPRKVRSRESFENIRIDKQRRYQGLAGDRTSRTKRNATWLGAGLGAYGVAKFFGAGSDSESSSDERRLRRRHVTDPILRRSSRDGLENVAGSVSTPQVNRTYSEQISTRPKNVSLPLNRSERDAALLVTGAVGVTKAGSGHRGRQEQHNSKLAARPTPNASALATFDVGRHRPLTKVDEHVSPRRAQVLGVERRRRRASSPSSTSSTSSQGSQDAGFFTRMFGTPKKSKRRSSGHRRPRHDSRSSDDFLIERRDQSSHRDRKDSKSKPVKRERRSSDERAKIALAGLGTAAAALAAHEASKNHKTLANGRDAPHHGLAPPPGKPQALRQAQHEDGWESASDDGEDSEDSGLAFDGGRLGRHPSAHLSAESLASSRSGSGTDKWNWRWGPNRRHSPNHREPSQIDPFTPAAPPNVRPAQKERNSQAERPTGHALRRASSEPLQVLDPHPDYNNLSRHTAPEPDSVPSPKPLVRSKTEDLTLQQPQPVPPRPIPPEPVAAPPEPTRRVSFAAETPRRPLPAEDDSDPPTQYPPRHAYEEAQLSQAQQPRRFAKSPIPSPRQTSSEGENEVDGHVSARGRRSWDHPVDSKPSFNSIAATGIGAAAAGALVGASLQRPQRESESAETGPKDNQDTDFIHDERPMAISQPSPPREPPPSLPTEESRRKVSESVRVQHQDEQHIRPVDDKGSSMTSIPLLPSGPPPPPPSEQRPTTSKGSSEETTTPFPQLPSEETDNKTDRRGRSRPETPPSPKTSLQSSSSFEVRRPAQKEDSSDDDGHEKFNPDFFKKRKKAVENARNDREYKDVQEDLAGKYTKGAPSAAELWMPEEFRDGRHDHDPKVYNPDPNGEGFVMFPDDRGFPVPPSGNVPGLHIIPPTPPRSESTAPQRHRMPSPRRFVEVVQGSPDVPAEIASSESGERKGIVNANISSSRNPSAQDGDISTPTLAGLEEGRREEPRESSSYVRDSPAPQHISDGRQPTYGSSTDAPYAKPSISSVSDVDPSSDALRKSSAVDSLRRVAESESNRDQSSETPAKTSATPDASTPGPASKPSKAQSRWASLAALAGGAAASATDKSSPPEKPVSRSDSTAKPGEIVGSKGIPEPMNSREPSKKSVSFHDLPLVKHEAYEPERPAAERRENVAQPSPMPGAFDDDSEPEPHKTESPPREPNINPDDERGFSSASSKIAKKQKKRDKRVSWQAEDQVYEPSRHTSRDDEERSNGTRESDDFKQSNGRTYSAASESDRPPAGEAGEWEEEPSRKSRKEKKRQPKSTRYDDDDSLNILPSRAKDQSIGSQHDRDENYTKKGNASIDIGSNNDRDISDRFNADDGFATSTLSKKDRKKQKKKAQKMQWDDDWADEGNAESNRDVSRSQDIKTGTGSRDLKDKVNLSLPWRAEDPLERSTCLPGLQDDTSSLVDDETTHRRQNHLPSTDLQATNAPISDESRERDTDVRPSGFSPDRDAGARFAKPPTKSTRNRRDSEDDEQRTAGPRTQSSETTDTVNETVQSPDTSKPPHWDINSFGDGIGPFKADDLPFGGTPPKTVQGHSRKSSSQRNSITSIEAIGSPQTLHFQRQSSSTAVPLRFRKPPASPVLPRDAEEQAPDIDRPSSPSTPNRARPSPRPTSTEFKSTNEFRPLYLVERNSKTLEPQESLPSLPSSNSDSRAPSVHESSDGDAYESALESPNAPPSVQSDDFVPHIGTGPLGPDDEYLGSGQTTPRANISSPIEIQRKSGYFDTDHDVEQYKQEPYFETDEDVQARPTPSQQAHTDSMMNTDTVVAGAAAMTGAALARPSESSSIHETSGKDSGDSAFTEREHDGDYISKDLPLSERLSLAEEGLGAPLGKEKEWNNVRSMRDDFAESQDASLQRPKSKAERKREKKARKAQAKESPSSDLDSATEFHDPAISDTNASTPPRDDAASENGQESVTPDLEKGLYIPNAAETAPWSQEQRSEFYTRSNTFSEPPTSNSPAPDLPAAQTVPLDQQNGTSEPSTAIHDEFPQSIKSSGSPETPATDALRLAESTAWPESADEDLELFETTQTPSTEAISQGAERLGEDVELEEPVIEPLTSSSKAKKDKRRAKRASSTIDDDDDALQQSERLESEGADQRAFPVSSGPTIDDPEPELTGAERPQNEMRAIKSSFAPAPTSKKSNKERRKSKRAAQLDDDSWSTPSQRPDAADALDDASDRRTDTDFETSESAQSQSVNKPEASSSRQDDNFQDAIVAGLLEAGFSTNLSTSFHGPVSAKHSVEPMTATPEGKSIAVKHDQEPVSELGDDNQPINHGNATKAIEQTSDTESLQSTTEPRQPAVESKVNQDWTWPSKDVKTEKEPTRLEDVDQPAEKSIVSTQASDAKNQSPLRNVQSRVDAASAALEDDDTRDINLGRGQEQEAVNAAQLPSSSGERHEKPKETSNNSDSEFDSILQASLGHAGFDDSSLSAKNRGVTFDEREGSGAEGNKMDFGNNKSTDPNTNRSRTPSPTEMWASKTPQLKSPPGETVEEPPQEYSHPKQYEPSTSRDLRPFDDAESPQKSSKDVHKATTAAEFAAAAVGGTALLRRESSQSAKRDKKKRKKKSVKFDAFEDDPPSRTPDGPRDEERMDEQKLSRFEHLNQGQAGDETVPPQIQSQTPIAKSTSNLSGELQEDDTEDQTSQAELDRFEHVLEEQTEEQVEAPSEDMGLEPTSPPLDLPVDTQVGQSGAEQAERPGEMLNSSGTSFSQPERKLSKKEKKKQKNKQKSAADSATFFEQSSVDAAMPDFEDAASVQRTQTRDNTEGRQASSEDSTKIVSTQRASLSDIEADLREAKANDQELAAEESAVEETPFSSAAEPPSSSNVDSSLQESSINQPDMSLANTLPLYEFEQTSLSTVEADPGQVPGSENLAGREVSGEDDDQTPGAWQAKRSNDDTDSEWIRSADSDRHNGMAQRATPTDIDGDTDDSHFRENQRESNDDAQTASLSDIEADLQEARLGEQEALPGDLESPFQGNQRASLSDINADIEEARASRKPFSEEEHRRASSSDVEADIAKDSESSKDHAHDSRSASNEALVHPLGSEEDRSSPIADTAVEVEAAQRHQPKEVYQHGQRASITEIDDDIKEMQAAGLGNPQDDDWLSSTTSKKNRKGKKGRRAQAISVSRDIHKPPSPGYVERATAFLDHATQTFTQSQDLHPNESSQSMNVEDAQAVPATKTQSDYSGDYFAHQPSAHEQAETGESVAQGEFKAAIQTPLPEDRDESTLESGIEDVQQAHGASHDEPFDHGLEADGSHVEGTPPEVQDLSGRLSPHPTLIVDEVGTIGTRPELEALEFARASTNARDGLDVDGEDLATLQLGEADFHRRPQSEEVEEIKSAFPWAPSRKLSKKDKKRQKKREQFAWVDEEPAMQQAKEDLRFGSGQDEGMTEDIEMERDERLEPLVEERDEEEREEEKEHQKALEETSRVMPRGNKEIQEQEQQPAENDTQTFAETKVGTSPLDSYQDEAIGTQGNAKDVHHWNEPAEGRDEFTYYGAGKLSKKDKKKQKKMQQMTMDSEKPSQGPVEDSTTSEAPQDANAERSVDEEQLENLEQRLEGHEKGDTPPMNDLRPVASPQAERQQQGDHFSTPSRKQSKKEKRKNKQKQRLAINQDEPSEDGGEPDLPTVETPPGQYSADSREQSLRPSMTEDGNDDRQVSSTSDAVYPKVFGLPIEEAERLSRSIFEQDTVAGIEGHDTPSGMQSRKNTKFENIEQASYSSKVPAPEQQASREQEPITDVASEIHETLHDVPAAEQEQGSFSAEDQGDEGDDTAKPPRTLSKKEKKKEQKKKAKKQQSRAIDEEDEPSATTDQTAMQVDESNQVKHDEGSPTTTDHEPLFKQVRGQDDTEPLRPETDETLSTETPAREEQDTRMRLGLGKESTIYDQSVSGGVESPTRDLETPMQLDEPAPMEDEDQVPHTYEFKEANENGEVQNERTTVIAAKPAGSEATPTCGTTPPESTTKSRGSSLFISPPVYHSRSIPDMGDPERSGHTEEDLPSATAHWHHMHPTNRAESPRGLGLLPEDLDPQTDSNQSREPGSPSRRPQTDHQESPSILRRQRSRPLEVITEGSREPSPTKRAAHRDEAEGERFSAGSSQLSDRPLRVRRGSNDLRRASMSPSGSELANVRKAYIRSPVSATYSTASGDLIRPSSAMSNHSRAGSTTSNHSLRRIDEKTVSRSISSDLRAAAKRDGSSAERAQAQGSGSNAKTPLPAPVPLPHDYEPLKGPGVKNTKDRRQDMSDGGVFVSLTRHSPYDECAADSLPQETLGDARGSPRSPTRPPSIRKRQSLQVLELQNKLDEAIAENDSLKHAHSRSQRGLDDSDANTSLQKTLQERDIQLNERNIEIRNVKIALQTLQTEIERLTEHNGQLQTERDNLGADVNQRYAALQQERDEAQSRWQDSTRQVRELQGRHDKLSSGMEAIVRQEISSALDSKDAEIRSLRAELEDASDRIDSLQQRAATVSPSDDFLNLRDEIYIGSACQQLFEHVKNWVLRFSKYSDNRKCRLSADVKDETIETRLDNTMLDGTDVDDYLADRVLRRDVFISVVMNMIWEYVFTRYLFGLDREQRQKLKSLEKTLSDVGPPKAVAHWRATTLSLLSRREAFYDQRSQDTDAVVNEIMKTLGRLLPPPGPQMKQVQDSLRNIVNLAVDLSIEIRTQRAEYLMLPTPRPEYDTNGELAKNVFFNSTVMNEASEETASNEELEEKSATVRVVLFPLVVKRGNDYGEEDVEIVVNPAQVLTSKPTKRRSGVMSGANRSTISVAAPPSAAPLPKGPPMRPPPKATMAAPPTPIDDPADMV